jgi:hypothetical protein
MDRMGERPMGASAEEQEGAAMSDAMAPAEGEAGASSGDVFGWWFVGVSITIR